MTIQHHLLTLANRFHRCQSLCALSTSVIKCNSPYSTLTDYTRIHSAPLTQVTTLPNGLRVATESNLSSETATVGVWIEAGSGFESVKTNGTGKFLKRVLLNGGTERRTKRQLDEEIENMGGKFGSSGSRQFTAYYGEVADKDVPQALDILSDILQNPKLRKKRIESERYEILRVIKELEEKPHEAIFDHLYANAFKKTINGQAENVKTITKKDLINYMSTHYTTPRMVIAAVGAVKHEEIVQQVKSKFTKLLQGSTTTSVLAAKDKTIFTASELRILDDDVPLAHFVIAFNGASRTDPDFITLAVINAILGAYSKSLDIEEHTSTTLVERLGIREIAENIDVFHFPEDSLFGVHARAKPDCVDVLAQSIMYEVTQLCYKVSEDDVVRARKKLKSFLLHIMDDNTANAWEIVEELLTWGRRIPYAEQFARIDDVDASSIKRVANRFIFDKDIAIAAVGPVQSLPSYDWFRRCGGSKTSIHPRLKYSIKAYRNKC